MGNITEKSTKFPASVVSEIFSKVNGHSTLAKLAKRTPVAFSGNDIFTFNLDDEVEIVGEGGDKGSGGATVAPVSVRPIKVVYQHRMSDEFLKVSEEKQLAMLGAFKDGFSVKIGTGLDIMGFHGVNPRTLTKSDTIGDNHLDTVQSVNYTEDKPEDALEDAVEKVGDNDITGYALSRGMGTALGKLKVNGVPQYPEFALGGNPGTLGRTQADVNSTVTKGNENAMGYVGDFAKAFVWGYAEDMTFEIIKYGDPDGQGDLKRKNQIVLRAEAYVGWGILNKEAFARIVKTA
jgi:HK97 family phage major capsid protein